MFSHNVSKHMIKNCSFYTVPNYDQTLSLIPSNIKNVTIDGCQDKGLWESQPDPIEMLMVVGTDQVGIKKFISSKLCLLFIILYMNADVDLVCCCPELF